MSELGMRLKAAREERGYSLEELQTITKIQKRYLTAIEEGDFSRLPGDFYVRAFVKSFSEAVGINPEILFEEHGDELPKPKREPVELPPRVNRSKPKMVKKKSKFSSLIPTIIAILFIIAIFISFWYYNQRDGEENVGVSREEQQGNSEIDNTGNISDDEEDELEEDVVQDTEENNDEVEEEIDEEIEEEETLEQSISFDESEGNRASYTLSNAENFNVRLEMTGGSWVQLRDSNNEVVHERTHSGGDEEEFDFSNEEQITFNLGHTPTVNIYINDELLEYELEVTRQYVIVNFETPDTD